MARLVGTRKTVRAVGKLLSRSSVLRTVGQHLSPLSFMSGGLTPGRSKGASWDAVVLGVPDESIDSIDRAFPEFRKVFATKQADPVVLRDLLAKRSGMAVITWSVAGGPQLSKIQAMAIEGHPVLSLDRAPIDIPYGETALNGYVLDWTGFYCNSRRTSDLEIILNQFAFIEHPEMLTKAATLIRTRFPKSNRSGPVLVVCQHRLDPPAVFAGAIHPDAKSLVDMARAENPRADIVIVPVCTSSADLAQQFRAELTPLGHVADDDEIEALLLKASRVYVASALIGFRALLAGIPVTTMGAPFYAGWGLTDDRRPVPRRQRTLTLGALAAGTMLIYSRYLCNDELMSLETLVPAPILMETFESQA